MAGTIIADFIRTDANQLSLNVGNTTFATINAGGFYSNTGVQIISPTGTINAASIAAGSIPVGKLGAASVSRTNMYSGAVLQMVSVTTTTQFTSSSTTFADIGLTATITPTNSSSKILIMATFGDTSSQNNSGPAGNKLILYRNATQLGGGLSLPSGNFANQWNYAGAANHMISSGGVVFVDSPSSTSALTYKFQGATQTAGKTMEFMRDQTNGTLILMEIAG